MKHTGSPYSLVAADLSWHSDETPVTNQFDDVYFSPDQGLEETRYVFLTNSRLSQRWPQLPDNSTFTIGETGFGTGLNFLASWQQWRALVPSTAKLIYISTEKHPLSLLDLKKALANWPELSELSQNLIEQYPPSIPGQHLLSFDHGRVNLILILGDATEGLEQLRYSDHPDRQSISPYYVNAWFLDGFAPAKNPQLWNDRLYSLIADLSTTGTTFATFTAAGDVRRGLLSQGFEVEKAKGFGKKREMLTGIFRKTSQVKPASVANTATTKKKKTVSAPWYIKDLSQLRNPSPGHVAIIGGGLAGITSAHAFAKRGNKVTLIERADQLASGGSGNPQGILFTKLSPEAGLLNQFTLASYLYALRFYHQWQHSNNIDSQYINFCGMLQLATSEKEEKLFHSISTAFSSHPQLVKYLSAAHASDMAGVPLQQSALFFPGSGWLSPANLCKSLSDNPNIQTVFNSHALQLRQQADQWQIIGTNNEECLLTADTVVIANAVDALQFEQSATLPLKPIRGQVTSMPSNPISAKLKTVICHEGYITPTLNGEHNIGATFDNGDSHTDLRSSDHQKNITSLQRAMPDTFPELIAQDEIDKLIGRASLRCASPDYLPLVGPVGVRENFARQYAALSKNSLLDIKQAGSYYPNLYINVGHGSRGITSTPLCAELLASFACNEPPPLAREFVKALNPARFILRDIIRNKYQ